MAVLAPVGHQTKQKRVEDVQSDILGLVQPMLMKNMK